MPLDVDVALRLAAELGRTIPVRRLSGDPSLEPMANRRQMSHGVRCLACGDHWMPKDGSSRGRQTYRCGGCGKRSQPDAAYRRATAAQQRQAVAMRRGGMSVRAIAAVLEVSPATVSRWTQ